MYKEEDDKEEWKKVKQKCITEKKMREISLLFKVLTWVNSCESYKNFI